MIVVDVSAAISALLNAGPARRALGESQLHVPHLIDTEVANGLRRLVVSGEIDAGSWMERTRHLASPWADPLSGLFLSRPRSGSFGAMSLPTTPVTSLSLRISVRPWSPRTHE